jgi:hypothetical protein
MKGLPWAPVLCSPASSRRREAALGRRSVLRAHGELRLCVPQQGMLSFRVAGKEMA